MNAGRIKILDSFRAIAIISVLLYHFFSRWAVDEGIRVYPYGDRYNYFGYGNLGVQFFFIISGFVIFKTLESTETFRWFWLKRLIRLLPSMFVASILIFVTLRVIDNRLLFPQSHQFKNLLPGITFINPEVYNRLFHPLFPFKYINGSFWSLWCEIQFYFLSSTLFYLNRKLFLPTFLATSTVIIVVTKLLEHYASNQVTNGETITTQLYYYWIGEVFDLPYYLSYFALGMVLYLFFKSKNEENWLPLPTVAMFVFFATVALHSSKHWQSRILVAGMIALFLLFIYRPEYLSFLSKSIFTSIGAASYFIYLIHEYIGVVLIHKSSALVQFPQFMAPVILIAGFVLLGLAYSNTIERRVTLYLRNKFRV